LRPPSSRRFVSPSRIAVIYVGLGDKERALDELEKTYEARSWSLLSLKMDNIFDRRRSEPRFIALLKKGGPEQLTARSVYSRTGPQMGFVYLGRRDFSPAAR
jgi:hypothetical protein